MKGKARQQQEQFSPRRLGEHLIQLLEDHRYEAEPHLIAYLEEHEGDVPLEAAEIAAMLLLAAAAAQLLSDGALEFPSAARALLLSSVPEEQAGDVTAILMRLCGLAFKDLQ